MSSNVLFRRLQRKKFSPTHAAEVGVYLPETSNIYDFILAGVRCTLVEPDPGTVAKIKAHFADSGNVSLHPVAVYDQGGTLDLVKRGASTYAAAIEKSPAVVNDGYHPQDKDRFTVTAVTFDQVDDGSIDLLSVDVEGGEWFVLKHMVSRPAVISVETHGALYENPYMAEIEAWTRNNSYRLWYKDKSDSVYVKAGAFNVTLLDKVRLLATDVRLRLKRLKKRATRQLRGVNA